MLRACNMRRLLKKVKRAQSRGVYSGRVGEFAIEWALTQKFRSYTSSQIWRGVFTEEAGSRDLERNWRNQHCPRGALLSLDFAAKRAAGCLPT